MEERERKKERERRRRGRVKVLFANFIHPEPRRAFFFFFTPPPSSFLLSLNRTNFPSFSFSLRTNGKNEKRQGRNRRRKERKEKERKRRIERKTLGINFVPTWFKCHSRSVLRRNPVFPFLLRERERERRERKKYREREKRKRNRRGEGKRMGKEKCMYSNLVDIPIELRLFPNLVDAQNRRFQEASPVAEGRIVLKVPSSEWTKF